MRIHDEDMNEKKALVVYESMFGNSEQIARGVAAGLATHARVEVVDVDEAATAPIEQATLLVVGGPTHAFSMSRARTREDARRQGAHPSGSSTGIREWLESTRFRPGQPVAVFDTRVAKVRHLPGSAARAALKLARRRGLEPLDKPHSFYVEDVGGPLLGGELENAEAWGDGLGTLLEEVSS